MICGRHGSKQSIKDLYQPYQNGNGASVEGRFNRLFQIEEPTYVYANGHTNGNGHSNGNGTHAPLLRPDTSPKHLLQELGKSGGLMDEGKDVDKPGDSKMPAGYTFLGQFIDHDITFDTVSQLDSVAKPGSIRNGRTPSLDLDCVYGGGPEQSPFLFVQETANTPHGRMVLQTATDIHTEEPFDELPRFPVGNDDNGKPVQRAIIGDMRNDENPFVAQLQLAMIKFHNAIHEQVGDLEKARDTVIHYYHRIIMEDFLPRLIDEELLTTICTDGNCYYTTESGKVPNMPVEYSVAAYRYGHSQVRAFYDYNDYCRDVALFDLGAFRNVESKIDWKYLFEVNGGADTQMARKIDPKLPNVLMNMPHRVGGDAPSLADRNLRRGRTFRLPSGQAIAEQMQEDGALIGGKILPVNQDLKDLGFKQTPLWFYCLEESQEFGKGTKLGPVGGRIVAEVMVGLIEEYRNRTGKGYDYLPDVEVPQADPTAFRMPDLLDYAGVL